MTKALQINNNNNALNSITLWLRQKLKVKNKKVKGRIIMEGQIYSVTERHKFPDLKSYKGKHLNKYVVIPEQRVLKPNSSGITGK